MGTIQSNDSGQSRVVDLRTAAKLSGRSERTIRRWVRDGLVKDQRSEGDHASRILVREDDIKKQVMSGARSPDVVDVPLVSTGHAGQVVALNGHIDDLRHTRDKLEGQVATLQEQVEAQAEQLRDKDLRIASLEQQLHGGVRGLLKGVFRR